MPKIINFIWYIIIWIFLFVISFVNIEKIINLDFTNIYVLSFFWFFIFWLFLIIIQKIFTFAPLIRGSCLKDWGVFKELKYIAQFILFSCILLLPWFFINHHFLAEHLWENNLYLRVYWKLAMWYFAMALIISPILEFVKHPIWREHLILSRKILWILSAIFFLKHWLEYFALEYIFQNKFHVDTPYIDYVINNLLVRFDALSWVVAWILMLILLLTSNKFSQRFLWWKKWKKIQFLVFPAFLLSAVHIAFASRFDEFYIFLISIVVILRLVSYLNRKQRRRSWKIVWYRCIPCWYIYDEKIWDLDSWIAPWTKFEDIPEDWSCPVCWVTKDDFEPIYEWEEISETAKIVWYKMLTDDVLELKIKILNLDNIVVKPWQFTNIWFWDFERSYSVVKQEKNILTFVIKLKKDWKASEVLKKSKLWDKLKFNWIFWKFILKNTKNPKVFIATGTGLSPIINMLNNSKEVEKTLFFWVQKESDLFYINKLEKIKKLNLEIFLSREENNKYNYWRINLSKHNFSKNTEFYICWNNWLVEDSKKYLSNLWFKNIYHEIF